MENVASEEQEPDRCDTVENSAANDAHDEPRSAPRFTLLIRAAKFVAAHGEFVCVIRDVSQTGLSVRLFHDMPSGQPVELHMPGGSVYDLRSVWQREREAGFEFVDAVDVQQFVNEAGAFPKRGLRLGLCFPIKVSTLTQNCDAIIENLSQQGARFSCDDLFAMDQSVRLECPESDIGFKEVRAKIRWRRDNQYGVVFDDTMTLREFAELAARLQCPELIG